MQLQKMQLQKIQKQIRNLQEKKGVQDKKRRSKWFLCFLRRRLHHLFSTHKMQEICLGHICRLWNKLIFPLPLQKTVQTRNKILYWLCCCFLCLGGVSDRLLFFSIKVYDQCVRSFFVSRIQTVNVSVRPSTAFSVSACIYVFLAPKKLS